MLKNISFTGFALAVFAAPFITRAQEVQAEAHHLEGGDLYFHIAAIVLSLIATIYMLTLVASFKGGLLEKVWNRFMWVSIAFTVLSIASYLQEADIFHVHFLTEIVQILIAILLITVSYKTLKQIVLK